MFILDPNPTFRHEITARVPVDGGFADQKFQVTYRVMADEEQKDFDINENTSAVAFLKRVVVGLDDIEGPDGARMGVKMDSTGASIGGALGSATGIPGGDIAGAILGGLVGNLFAPMKAGNAAIVNGDISTNATTKSMNAAATSLAGKVTEGVSRIAQALGGSLGSYDLSIGTYKDKYRVRDTAFSGKSLDYSGTSAIGLHNFGDDEGAAITYAISNAIADGAVLGLSEAVQKALKSSTDLDKAIGDALKVQETEALIGGLGYELDKLFRDAEANARERVRVARAYGLDVLAVEKANAEERSKLIEQTVSQSVGSLQQLLDDMRFGDMFEGDASQQRTQLLAEIADARADAQAGEEGAGDRLADLYRRLTETSRAAFGTAGSEYASDRALAQSGAAEIIKLENDRVRAAADAQAATTAAVNAGNRLQDETNDQLAQMNTRLNEIAARLAAGTALVPNTTSVARTTALK